MAAATPAGSGRDSRLPAEEWRSAGGAEYRSRYRSWLAASPTAVLIFGPGPGPKLGRADPIIRISESVIVRVTSLPDRVDVPLGQSQGWLGRLGHPARHRRGDRLGVGPGEDGRGEAATAVWGR